MRSIGIELALDDAEKALGYLQGMLSPYEGAKGYVTKALEALWDAMDALEGVE